YYLATSRTAAAENSPLSLHDALPISGDREGGAGEGDRRRLQGAPGRSGAGAGRPAGAGDGHEGSLAVGEGRHRRHPGPQGGTGGDRKSTRLNSSHVSISYAVFCLKKK